MRISTSLTVIVLTASVAAALPAQSVLDAGARAGPQIHQYTFGAPTNITVSEFSTPLFALVPITSAFTIDVGTAYAASHIEENGGAKSSASDIAGLTDTQVRGTYTIGTDFVVLSAGLNLPTGRSMVPPDQQVAAGLIGNDFLAFPIANMGTGLGGTGAIAVARPLGNWNLGFGASMRYSARYDPFASAAGGSPMHYQPGNEYRGRIGVDHAFGTGRISAGFTYSKFGNDDIGGSVYNTGDRYLTQVALSNTVGAGDLWVSSWNLFRAAGTLADSSYLGRENIASAAMGYSIPALGGRVEPSVEARNWLQAGRPSSLLATLGLGVQWNFGSFGVAPSGGYTLGHFAAVTSDGTNATASLSGFHAMLAVRLR